MDTSTDIQTPATHPDHPIVGRYFAGYSSESSANELYFCDSYEPRLGYWLTNIINPADRKNVSARAIGSTFHEAHTSETMSFWRVPAWGIKFDKADLKVRADDVDEMLYQEFAEFSDGGLAEHLRTVQGDFSFGGSRYSRDRQLRRIQAEQARRLREQQAAQPASPRFKPGPYLEYLESLTLALLAAHGESDVRLADSSTAPSSDSSSVSPAAAREEIRRQQAERARKQALRVIPS